MAMTSKRNDSDIWTSLQPIYAILTWIFIGQFSVKGKTNNRIFTLIGYLSWYKIVSYFVTIGSIAIVVYTSNIYWAISKNVILKYLGFLKVYNCLALMVVTIICNSTSGPRVIEMLKRFIEIDAKLIKLGFRIDNKFARKVSIAYIACYLTIFIIENIYDNYNSNGIFFITAVTYLIINSYLYLISILYRSWFHVLNQRFTVINSCIDSLSTEGISLQKLRSLEVIFQDICKILKTASSSRSATLLFHIVMNFTHILIRCYLFYIADYEEVRKLSIELFLYTMDTILIIIYADNIKEKVDNKCKTIA